MNKPSENRPTGHHTTAAVRKLCGCLDNGDDACPVCQGWSQAEMESQNVGYWIRYGHLKFDAGIYTKGELDLTMGYNGRENFSEHGYLSREKMESHKTLCPSLFALEFRRIQLQPCLVEYYGRVGKWPNDHQKTITECGWFAHYNGILFLKTETGREESSHCRREEYQKRDGSTRVSYTVYPTTYYIATVQ